MRNQQHSWHGLVIGALSFVRFMEDTLDDKELALLLDGWTHWAKANYQDPATADLAITKVINEYAGLVVASKDSKAIESWKRVVGVYREIPYHLGEDNEKPLA